MKLFRRNIWKKTGRKFKTDPPLNNVLNTPSKKYYYKRGKNRFGNPYCLEDCKFKPKIKIGSENCSRCEYFYKGDASPLNKKHWILCRQLG